MAMSTEPWFFYSAGMLLLGASLATATSIFIGAFDAATSQNALRNAWWITATTAICGALCLFFASKERRVERTKAKDIVSQMEIIERRYENAPNRARTDEALKEATRKMLLNVWEPTDSTRRSE